MISINCLAPIPTWFEVGEEESVDNRWLFLFGIAKTGSPSTNEASPRRYLDEPGGVTKSAPTFLITLDTIDDDDDDDIKEAVLTA